MQPLMDLTIALYGVPDPTLFLFCRLWPGEQRGSTAWSRMCAQQSEVEDCVTCLKCSVAQLAVSLSVLTQLSLIARNLVASGTWPLFYSSMPKRNFISLASFNSSFTFSIVLSLSLFLKVLSEQKMAMTSRPDKGTQTCLRIARTYWHPVGHMRGHMKSMSFRKRGAMRTEAVVHRTSEKSFFWITIILTGRAEEAEWRAGIGGTTGKTTSPQARTSSMITYYVIFCSPLHFLYLPILFPFHSAILDHSFLSPVSAGYITSLTGWYCLES